jgi:hypothetical protein
MLSLRSHALITGALFAAILVLAWAGNLVEAYGLLPASPEIQIASLVLFFGLTVALAFSAVPLMVFVVGFPTGFGNTQRRVNRFLRAHQRAIVFVLWGLMAAGLLVAILAAILDGAFDASNLRR